jgi:hypothetical protein
VQPTLLPSFLCSFSIAKAREARAKVGAARLVKSKVFKCHAEIKRKIKRQPLLFLTFLLLFNLKVGNDGCPLKKES